MAVKSRDAFEQMRDRMFRVFAQAHVPYKVRETTDELVYVSLSLTSMVSVPEVFGVITPYGLSINLQDVNRLNGAEKVKLRDMSTMLQRDA